MKRKIFLIRHSYAESATDIQDKERTLTYEGFAEARSLARLLSQENFAPDKLLVSSAVRTQQTAQVLVEEMGMGDHLMESLDVMYNASIRELLGLINELDQNVKQVALIGHNPTISYLAEYLSGATIGGMQPAGSVMLQVDVKSWEEVGQGSCKFIKYIHPTFAK